MGKKCIVCLKKSKIVSIYEAVLNENLPEVIENISGIKVYRLPVEDLLICHDCAVALIYACSLVKKLRRALLRVTTQSKKKEKQDGPASDHNQVPVNFKEKKRQSEHTKKFTSDNYFDTFSKHSRVKEKNSFSDNNVETTKYETLNLKCEVCNYETFRPKLFRKHLLLKHGVQRTHIYQCAHCSESYQRFWWLKRHLSLAHEAFDNNKADEIKSVEREAECPELNKAECVSRLTPNTTSQTDLDSSKTFAAQPIEELCQTETSDNNKTTENMTQSTYNEDANDSLVKEVDENDIIPSDVAVISFPRPNSKRNWDLKCELCPYHTNSAKMFKRHLKFRHNIERSHIFKCTECSESYQIFRWLKYHYSIAHGEDQTQTVDQSNNSLSLTAQANIKKEQPNCYPISEITELLPNNNHLEACVLTKDGASDIKLEMDLHLNPETNNKVNKSQFPPDTIDNTFCSRETQSQIETINLVSDIENDSFKTEKMLEHQCSDTTESVLSHSQLNLHSQIEPNEHVSRNEVDLSTIEEPSKKKKKRKSSFTCSNENIYTSTQLESDLQINQSETNTDTLKMYNKTVETPKKEKQKPYACLICGKKFALIAKMQNHISKRHTIGVKNLPE